jgi:hypothetical protein
MRGIVPVTPRTAGAETCMRNPDVTRRLAMAILAGQPVERART